MLLQSCTLAEGLEHLGYRGKKTALGRHSNRARMYDANGNFVTALPNVEAERLVESGHATRVSRPHNTPLKAETCPRIANS